MAAQASRAHVALGRAVHDLRVRRNLSQEILAARGSLQRKTVNQLENARVDPQYTTLLRVAGALEVKISEILDHAEDLEDRARGMTRT